MNQKWDSKKLTAYIIFTAVDVGLLIAEFCTPNQDVFTDKPTLWLVVGLVVAFTAYIFGQSLIDAIKEIVKEIGAKWLEKKLGS